MKRYFSPPSAQISPFFLRLSCLLTMVEPIKISHLNLFNKAVVVIRVEEPSLLYRRVEQAQNGSQNMDFLL